MARDKEDNKLEGISILFKLAGISILIMNAKLMGETLYQGLEQSMGPYELLILFSMGVSVLETINNWASINQYIKYYNHVGLFAVDILTLGVLFEQAYVLTKAVEEGGTIYITTRVKFLLITYIALYVLYMLWNSMISRNPKISPGKRKKIIGVTRWRVAQIVLGIFATGVLASLERCGFIETTDIRELLWIWTTGAYLFWALLVLLFSQKLIDVLRIAMEAEHTA